MLALDIGTSSARALFFDARGTHVGRASGARVAWDTVEGAGFEADADRLVETVTRVVDQAVTIAEGRRADIAGVGVTTFWHSLLGVDAMGNAVTPVLPWMDNRSAAEAATLRARLDERAVHGRTGARFHPSYPAAKILWLQRAAPQAAHRVQTWMGFGEYLLLRLFGEARTHVSMASGTGLLDVRSWAWDPEVLEALDLSDEALLPVADSDRPHRGLRSPYAARWPALAAIPWYGPFGDGACSNVGVGCLTRDRVALTIGTSGAMRVAWTGEHDALPWGLWGYRVDGRRPIIGGALSNGGNLYAWLRGVLALDGDDAAVEAALARVRPASHGLTVLPFWAGERNPDWPADARGLIAGLSLGTRPVDVVRAVFEAVALRFRALYALLRPLLPSPHRLIASGAALRASPAWLRILADVLEHPVESVDVSESSARGAALLALEALGLVDDAAIPLRGRPQRPRKAGAYLSAVARHETLYARLYGHE